MDVIRVMSGVSFLFVVQEGRGRHSGFLFSGLLSPYGLMWNLAGSILIGCFVGPLVQVGRGRHSIRPRT